MKEYHVLIRDENLNTGKKAHEGEARFVLENKDGCVATLPGGEKVQFVPIPNQPRPSLMAYKFHPGKPAWTAFNHANRGKIVTLIVE